MRQLVAIPAIPGPRLYDALRAALAGTGPAVLPVSTDPAEAARVLAYLTDEAVEGRDAFLEKREPDWAPYPYSF